MNNLRVQYIKCFDRTNLIKYLQDENFTVEAEILKPKDIDGMRFLELTELDLVQWRLTPKQKQLILNCRDKILGENTTKAKTHQKPPVLKKPSQAIFARPNKLNASFSQELQSKLQLNKTPASNLIKSSENDHNEVRNMYIDMTQKTIDIQPMKVSKSDNNRNEWGSPIIPPQPKPNLAPRNEPPPKIANKSARPLPKPPAIHLLEAINRNKGNSTVLPENPDLYQTSGDEADYLHPEPSRRPLPAPPLHRRPSAATQRGNSLEKGKFLDVRKASSEIKSRCPAVPSPPEETAAAAATEDIYEEEPLDPIYEADPLVPTHADPVIPIQRYNDHQLKSTLLKWAPTVATRPSKGQRNHRPSWKNGKQLPLPHPDNPNNEPGRIWNTSDEFGLPKPPKFENKFQQAQLSLIKLLNGSTANEEFNPNNCPYYRNTDRKGAKQLLERIPNLEDGAFLFRNSDEYFLAITMYYQKRFYNVGLYRNCEGRFYCKTDNEKRVMTFKTLQDFIEHYKTHPVTLKMQGSDVKIFLKELLPPHIY